MSRTSQIVGVRGREVLDSRGKPTVEVEVHLAGGGGGRAIVPSGASTGQFEAHELRDGDLQRYDGLGVLRAVEAVNLVINPALRDFDVGDQAELDRRLIELDKTPTKSRLGANALLGASLAAAQAAAWARGTGLAEHLHELWRGTGGSAEETEVPAAPCPQRSWRRGGMSLPLPMVNMISGGLHAGRNLDLQDYLILPVGAGSFGQALRWVVAVYRRLGELLVAGGFEGVLVGDEGGYGPRLGDDEQPLSLLTAAIERAGLQPGRDVALGLDVASTHFFRAGSYHLMVGGERVLDARGMTQLLDDWCKQYPLISIEDGCAEDDWEGWRHLTERLGDRVQLIGDDLFTTNPKRVAEGVRRGCANSVLIKPNQIGTLTETLATLRLTQQAGYRPVVSARSGETEDCFIADLAVATGAGQIKIGSITRSERLAKYNQLLRLEERLGDQAQFVGGQIFEGLRPAWRTA